MRLEREPWNRCLWLPERNLAFVPIPKNGTTYIGKGIRNSFHADPMWLWELPECPTLVMWRCPFDRLVSFYEYIRQVNQKYPRQRECVVCDKGFDTYIRGILGTPDSERNMHYRSQYAQCLRDGHFVPTEIFRWDFAALKERIGFKKYPPTQDNKTVHGNHWTPELRSLVEREYQKDFEVWHARHRAPNDQRVPPERERIGLLDGGLD